MKMKIDLQKLYEKGIELHHYANTAYPLNGSKVWRDYKINTELVDEAVREQWKDVKELALYIHIPFCDSRCKYCEYTVLSGDESNLKQEYVELLQREMELYQEMLGRENRTIVGLDLGGGTPTALSSKEIGKIVNSALEGLDLTDNFSISIETTPKIATDLEKMVNIRKAGIERISMGIQTINPELLEYLGRQNNTVQIIKKANENIRAAGFKRFNIDLMYGFANQPLDSFISTVKFAIDLNPEYITLYRNRYKGTILEQESIQISLDKINQQYDAAYSLLTENGFEANIGKNTFSRIPNDPGTSAYLTKRVIEGMPYLGLGLGSQTMARESVYYNQGAASKKIGKYRELIQQGRFPVQDLYVLPPEEIMAKMICVSFYFGYINRKAFYKKFGIELEDKFKDEVNFLQDKGLMEFSSDLFLLTKTGKDSINGIIPLFYSQSSRDNLLNKSG